MALGIGGGILWTPVLMLGCGCSPQQAVSTSLAIQVVGLGSGSVAYLRAGRVRARLVLVLFATAVPGVVAGSLMAVRLPAAPVKLALGSMAMILALVFVSARETPERASAQAIDERALRRILPVPAFFGVLMGLLSVGVGEWLMPSLRKRLQLDMQGAVATVTPLMFLLASVAALSHGLLSENIQWPLFFFGAVGTLLGGQLGPRVADRLPDRGLKEAFAFAMILVGIHLIFQAL